MSWFRYAAVWGFSAAAAWAQCPLPNFVQAGEVSLTGTNSVAWLQRQADGSFTRQRYQTGAPYAKIDSLPQYQSFLVDCTAAAPRAFRPPSGWAPLADRPGASSLPVIFTDLVGAGNAARVSVLPDGLVAGSADNIAVALTNSDASLRTVTLYPVSKPAGVLAADFNRDGKRDIAVVSGSGVLLVFLGNGDGTLKQPVSYTAGQGPVAAAAFDVNGDGFPDLVVANNGSGDVSVLINNGDGTFRSAVSYPAGSSPLSIAVGDFNGDGRADIVTGSFGTLSLLFGNGDGTFRGATALPEHFTARQVAVGDFNKDGKPDLAAVDLATLIVLTGDGHGGFPVENDYAIDGITGGANPAGLLLTDFDGDGNLDVVLAAGHPDMPAPTALVSSIAVLFGRGDGTLIGPASYDAGKTAVSIAVADFNNDGKLDVAVASTSSDDFRILLGKGDGTFQPPVRMTIQGPGAPVSPVSLVARDLNGDGKPDLVVADANDSNVYVLLGQGDGSFQAPVRYPVGGLGGAAAVADVNGDGKPDLVISGPPQAGTSGWLGVLLGNGDGTFQAVRNTGGAGANPVAVVTGDFNRDGKPDVAILNAGTAGNTADPGGVLIFLNQGNGAFQAPASYQVGFNPTSLAAADFNGDGALDLVVTSTGASFTGSFVGVLLNNGNGTFAPPAAVATEFGARSIAVADLDLDGKPDLAIGHCCGVTHTTFMPGNGDGTFQPEVDFTADAASYVVALGDVNGDGKPDLIAGSLLLSGTGSFNSTLSIFPNISVSGPPQAPLAGSANPAAGSGLSQTLTFTFSDTGGWQSLTVVDVLINNVLDGRHACYVALVPSGATSGSLYLVDDAGEAGGPFQGMVLPSGSGSIGNGQCSISGAGSSVSGSGNNLTLTLAVTFNSSFAGNKLFYLAARDQAANNSGWQAMGTWAVPGPFVAGPVVSGVSPARSSLPAEAYAFTFTDSNGWQDIAVANILINTAIDGRQACYLAIVPSSANSAPVFLVDNAGDAGGPYAGLVLPGTGTVSNGQCTVSGAASTVSGSGNTLNVTLGITFSPSFAGNQVLFAAARSNTLSSGWQAVGTTTVP